MHYQTLSPPQRWILKGIPILFIIGTLTHFLYDFSNNNLLIGIITPINESIWEHCKMVLWPIILYWSLYYLFRGSTYEIDADKWFLGALISLTAALLSIPMLYYFYTQAFGAELLWADILILLAAVTIGQLLGLHFYNHAKGIPFKLSLMIFVLLIILFSVFTFMPPNIPLFMESPLL